jgi:hypothetical protein
MSLALAIVLAAVAPASAQINLVGYWSPLYDQDWLERIPGPDVGDYAGLPITAAACRRANTWEASLLTLPEHQCKPLLDLSDDGRQCRDDDAASVTTFRLDISARLAGRFRALVHTHARPAAAALVSLPCRHPLVP